MWINYFHFYYFPDVVLNEYDIQIFEDVQGPNDNNMEIAQKNQKIYGASKFKKAKTNAEKMSDK